jgi:NAD(P)H dehydrogenase (quinone)
MANVLLVFWSRFGTTERLALAAAVGAVNGRANIRLRWLREDVSEDELAAVPGWKERRAQMEREYIAPRPVDLEWAHGLVLATPERVGADAPQWQAFFALGSLEGKAGGALGPLADAMHRAGMRVVEGSGESSGTDAARALGRRVAGAASAGSAAR